MSDSEPTVAPTLIDDLPSDVSEPLRHIFEGVEPRHGLGFVYEGGPAFKVTGLQRTPPIWLVYFILSRVLGAPDRGRDEKLAWECTLTVQGISCSVALQKFGLRVCVASDEADDDEHAAAIAQDLIDRVRRAAGLVESHILRGIAEERVASGNLTIDNQHRWFREMYEHFRRRAEQGFKDAETTENPPPERIVSSDGHEGWLHLNHRFELRRQAEFDSVAALSAYFSMIEHLLVIAVAFTSFDPERQSLEQFIGDRWSEKFKCVVQIDGQPEAQRAYNVLYRIAEELRNPQAHGGFDHQQSRFHFHLPGVGAVPARLSRRGRGTTYTFDSDGDQGATSVWSDLDELDSWLQTGPLRFAWRYAESGLDMPFDRGSREWLLRAVADGDEEFDRYLEGMLEWQDRAMNMDW